MATRFLFASLPKTHPKTKPSQHRTPFSAVATPRPMQVSRLKASRILETIYEEETTFRGEGMKEIANVVTTCGFRTFFSSHEGEREELLVADVERQRRCVCGEERPRTGSVRGR
ncbi:hypothetical protein QVD17_18063 [Tagetes erecta]|uniref:Uncharacterized protein n=1 Tax=Tagetes erecta TaxID=13708 RepID=A0AAD8NVR1_TARER|nr:hypothetical protein QVD17_18063 [Tagetes erecta]